MRNQITQLEKRYKELKEKINIKKANGSLSELLNLKREFDETFDQFFDDEELRKKYDDWNYEEECIKFEKTNSDLEKELDAEDLKRYIEFFQNYIGELEDELSELA